MADRDIDIAGLSSAEAKAYQTFLQNRRFGSLDGLRTVSVIAVIWHHCNQHVYGGILSAGYTGCNCFCDQWILITTLLLREKAQHGEISCGNFTSGGRCASSLCITSWCRALLVADLGDG